MVTRLGGWAHDAAPSWRFRQAMSVRLCTAADFCLIPPLCAMRHRHTRPQRVTLVLMIRNPSLPLVATALLEPEPDVSRGATCPLCHTTDASLTADALKTGGNWRCVRCGQRWDAARLATVAAYTAWVAERDVRRPVVG